MASCRVGRPQRARSAGVALVGATILAAGSLDVPVGLRAVPQPPEIVRAGSARVDITPPPGYPTGGHGPSGATARGYWGALTATALYFEDSAGRASALVSADLFAIPNALHQAVARHFAEGRHAVSVPLERLVIAATHTHHGPGNYLSVELHNQRGSRKPGYDSRLRDFLRKRLVTAIEAAIDDAAAHPTFQLDIVSGVLGKELLRNRSPRVFMRNTNREAILAAFGSGIPGGAAACRAARMEEEPTDGWDLEGCPRLRAVDRRVSILRLRRNGRTEAMAVFLAAHPTVLPASTSVFSADVFGIARAVLEQSPDHSVGHVAFFNGAEGDITMRRTRRNAADLLVLGKSLSAAIKVVHDTGRVRPIGRGPIEGRLRFVSPGTALTTQLGEHIARLAKRAVGGVAAAGGGEDDRTFLYRLGFREGYTNWPPDEQGVKVPAFGIVNDIVFPQHVFPTQLPLSIVSIGDFTLTMVPFEMSTAVGYAVRRALGSLPTPVLIVGLANEYGSYAATFDEYQAQDYMGASTLWGPEQAAFIVEALRRLAQAPSGFVGTPPLDDPGKEEAFGPDQVGTERERIFKGLEDLFKTSPRRPRPSHFYWCESAPPPLPAQSGRLVEVLREDGTVADRVGVVVMLDGRPRDGRSRWAAIWVSPLAEVYEGRYRFKVVRAGSAPIVSALFNVGSNPPNDCSKLP